jgi:hypothetical protein
MQLLTPGPERAPYRLRAVTSVARAAEGGLQPAHRAMLHAVQSLVLHTDLDVDALEPIAPDALAARFDDPPLARQLVRGMVAMSLAVGPPSEAQTGLIGAYAGALGVEEPAVGVMDRIAREELLRFRLDFYRRSHLRDHFGNQYRNAGGIIGVAKAVLGLKGLIEDPALAARFRALGELPEDTLGHGFYRYYTDNGFAFPGEASAFVYGRQHVDLKRIRGSKSATGSCDTEVTTQTTPREHDGHRQDRLP